MKSNRGARLSSKQIATSPFPMMLRNQPTGNFDKRSSNSSSMLNQIPASLPLSRATTLTAAKMGQLNPGDQMRHQSVLEVTKHFQKITQ
mmetsp:Transcript_40558/g.61820  ORF Transcript_40558/g.61820 Transcript_40558/m.61820 type:complete len:89 (-) Transcript_40558:259-525(-)